MQHYATTLRSKDLSHRQTAIRELCKLGANIPLSAVETLIPLLQDSDEVVREGATEALINMAESGNGGQARLVEQLGDLLHHPQEMVRIRAIGILARVGPAAAPLIPVLLEGLKARNRIFCRMSAEALHHIGAPAIPALQQACSSPDTPVRLAAQWILSRLNGKPIDGHDTVLDAAKTQTAPNIAVPPPAETPTKEEERRTAPRYDCSHDVFYQIMSRQTDDLWWKAKIRDVSAGGFALEIHASIPNGTHLTVDLSEAHSGLERKRVAKVVHCRQTSTGGWLVGCAWSGDLDQDELRLLREALKQ
jgi:hypothetical protein